MQTKLNLLTFIGVLVVSNALIAQTNTFPASGNVGIGTISPTSQLDVLPFNANAITIRAYGTATGNTGQLQFKELVANGAHYVGLKAPDSLAANYVYKLPINYGTSGQLLTTNGAGTLSWTSATGASTSLNNLVATSINQTLRPNTTNTKDLGSTTLAWRDIYMNGKLFLGGTTFIKKTGGICIGLQAGNVSTATVNTFIGNYSGLRNTTGASNVFVGFNSGSFTTVGDGNTFIGDLTGNGNVGGTDNTLLGSGAEVGSAGLTNATAIGSLALVNTSNSLILGYNAQVGIGTSAPEAMLHVSANSGITNPQLLLYENENDYARLSFKNSTSSSYWSIAGITSATNSSERLNFYNSTGGDVMSLTGNGNVCIGTLTPATGYKLSVAGKAIFTEIKVQPKASWPDYVFENDYKLMPLEELSDYIHTNKCLPGILSASEVQSNNGFEVGVMQTVVVQKLEELTLYILQQQAQINDLKAENKAIQGELNKLKK